MPALLSVHTTDAFVHLLRNWTKLASPQKAVCQPVHPLPCSVARLGLDGGQDEVALLQPAVQSVLQAASESAHSMQSTVTPLVGNSVAGWPASLAAQIHVQQVLRFYALLCRYTCNCFCAEGEKQRLAGLLLARSMENSWLQHKNAAVILLAT